MSEEVVLVETDNGVATVTLNRPKARNALNQELRRALYRTVKQLGDDDSIAAVILTGSDPAFCAGLDLKELAGSAGAALQETGASGETSSDRGPVPRIPKPLIGAINGVAITGGFEVALNCDFLIASEHARFADTHARMGIMPGWGLTVLLPEAVGFRRAKELSATGNFLDAQTALTWGLVNHVVPHDDLLPFTQQLAADIASNDTNGVRTIYGTYDAGALATGEEAWAIEGRAAGAWQSSGRDSADLEARRQAVTARGRTQL